MSRSQSTLFVAIVYWIFTAGCSFNGVPRIRMGDLAVDTVNTKFIDGDNLGNHCGSHFIGENNGILYTCRGGHIDTAHLRIAADYTRYLNNKIHKHLTAGRTSFKFRFNAEPSWYYITLEYPQDWQKLSPENKTQIIDQISLDLGQYIAFTMVSWHEILTWLNFKSVGVVSEFQSAFSWEDTYSNLLGTRIGASAVRNTELSFDKAATIALNKELDCLGIKSKNFARQAAGKMKDEWYRGAFFVEVLQRNMDIGIDDGYVTPVIVPGICDNPQPASYSAPTVDSFAAHDFSIDIEIKSNILEWPNILKIVADNPAGDRIKPLIHLPAIMRHLQTQALAKGYTPMPPKEPQTAPQISTRSGPAAAKAASQAD